MKLTIVAFRVCSYFLPICIIGLKQQDVEGISLFNKLCLCNLLFFPKLSVRSWKFEVEALRIIDVLFNNFHPLVTSLLVSRLEFEFSIVRSCHHNELPTTE